MHEYSLVRALLSQVEALRCEHDAQNVTAIRVCVGRFSGVEPDLFRMAYETLVETSAACRAVLHMEVAELEARVMTADDNTALSSFALSVPIVGAGRQRSYVVKTSCWRA